MELPIATFLLCLLLLLAWAAPQLVVTLFVVATLGGAWCALMAVVARRWRR